MSVLTGVPRKLYVKKIFFSSVPDIEKTCFTPVVQTYPNYSSIFLLFSFDALKDLSTGHQGVNSIKTHIRSDSLEPRIQLGFL